MLRNQSHNPHWHSWIALSICLASIFILCACQKENQDDKILDLQSINDLNGHKACVLAGSVQDIVVSKFVEPDDIMRISSVSELPTSVQSGKADFTALDTICLVGLDLEEKNLEIAFCMDDFSPIAVSFRKGDDQLRTQFNDFLKEIKSNGVLDSICDRWMHNPASASMPQLDLPQKGAPIRVGSFSNIFPASYIKDGEWAGFDVEMLYRFSQYINRPIELYDYEFTALIAALSTGKVDIAAAFTCITEERTKSVDFSEPYFFTRTVILQRAGKATAHNKTGFWEKLKTSFQRNLIEEDRWMLIVKGLGETLFISFFAILLGILAGALICALRMSRCKVLRGAAIAYIEVMRGVPILVFLMMLFYVVFATSQVTATWVAIIAFALNFGAYVSEMFRAGIEGVDKGQIEAGRALGFSKSSTFVNFVAPQALKTIFPVFKGEAVSLIKNTSIVGYIAIQDLTKASDIIRSRTFDAFFPLIFITIIYFLLAWLLGIALDSLNKKNRR